MQNLPHFILELANFHGGSTTKIIKLIRRFSKLNYDNLGIKFQVCKFDKLALPDYSGYNIYKELFISKDKWKEIIDLAYEKFNKVWLDFGDIYGIEIFQENIEKVCGLKLQASALDNLEIINALSKIDLNNKQLIINLSGYEISEIENYIIKFDRMNFKKVILQIGFQGYPTDIEDTSLRKIDILKALFPGHKICYADHISADDKHAQYFPIYAYIKGCSYLEKHVCLNRNSCKYDYFSALEYKKVEIILNEIKTVWKSHLLKFIVNNERIYLEKTIAKPILKNNLSAGQLVSNSDFIYRRTNKIGLNIKELKAVQNKFYVLRRDLTKHRMLNNKDFKKAKIAVIVAVRMKSSRLKDKAILPIQDIPSIERCFENCLKFKFIDKVILATSTLKEDQILEDYTLEGKVKFWQGDPEDVISRYLGACEKYNIDIVIRVTGDCPVISPEIAEVLLKSHFKEGADYTGTNEYAVGSNVEIYNVEALKRVIFYFSKANYSEYMTCYLINNSEIFKINIVNLPDALVRNYRLTLDYKDDLDMFNLLFQKLKQCKYEPNLLNIFKVLDNHPEIVNVNSHLTSRYKTDKNLIKKLNKVTKITK